MSAADLLGFVKNRDFVADLRDLRTNPIDFGKRVTRKFARLPQAFMKGAEEPSIVWFHSIVLPDGTVTPGQRELVREQQEAELIFSHDIAGHSVLDIGAWDGFFSFEAERRGAGRVVSTDWFCWGGPGWGTKQGYDFAHMALESHCSSVEVDVPDLSPSELGTFDTVLFLGVLYHLKDPLGGLERAAAMTHDHLIVETVVIDDGQQSPVMHYSPNYDGDATNFWRPNLTCVEEMLKVLGFTRFQEMWVEGSTTRRIYHAWR